MTLLRWIGPIAVLLLVLQGAPAPAQSSADAFFHDAAQHYVAGERAAAREAVAQGLAVAPEDPRLQALRKKLEQQEKRQGGGSSSQRGQQGGAQDQQSRGQQSRRQRSGEDGDESRSRAEAPSERQSSSSSSASVAPSGTEAQQQGADGRQAGDRRRATALSRVQAARLLRALEAQEMKLLREVQARDQQSKPVEKDW